MERQIARGTTPSVLGDRGRGELQIVFLRPSKVEPLYEASLPLLRLLAFGQNA